MILVGDAREQMATLEAESVQCIVTSPPYWGLRDYGVPDQLGLEKTPKEYIDTMVAVFREARRVLRKDGTLWLNMGDSYASGGRTEYDPDPKLPQRGGAHRNRITAINGLKPKDLVGMPWRLARALQEPYYTGKIKSREDRIWLAALVDTEGCIFIHKRKKGQSNGQGYHRKNDSYGAGLEIANTSRAIIDRCQQIAGIGSICEQGPNQNKRRKQIIYRWNVRSNECRWILREIYPHLIRKQNEARLAIGCPSSGEEAAKAHTSLIGIHRGHKPEIDFPTPETMFEQGWWVRSDIIWQKPNPMPESCRDRPTSAHEYIFLLTRSPRYFYDAEAVKEPTNGTAHARSAAAEEYPGNSLRNENRRRPGVNPKAKKPAGWESGPGSHRSLKGRHKQNESFSSAVTQPVGRRNLRNVWTISTQAFPDAHFATFPEALAKRCLMAGTSLKGACPDCGTPWERMVDKEFIPQEDVSAERGVRNADGNKAMDHRRDGDVFRGSNNITTTGWRPTCDCAIPDGANISPDPVPCVVLDMFAGSGTVGKVAIDLGLEPILIEINQEYIPMIEQRTKTTIGRRLN